MKIKVVKCPICSNKYVSKEGVYSHMEREHRDEIPQEISVEQFFYDLNHPGAKHVCTECGQPTGWNPRTNKYRRLCNKKECREKVRAVFRSRMLPIYYTDNLANSEEHQRKMLAGRKISGVYKWSMGGETSYVGSYEKDFLQVCDNLLDLKASDIMAPSPHTYYYQYEATKHFYIPDFFIPDLGLEIEIKDGGDNPNNHPKIQKVDKMKERFKDAAMMAQREYHYIKIVNKQYDKFIHLVGKLVNDDLDRLERRNKIKIYK